jgi:sterol desaturase/sphingolipid hydroxylase (fatty acid hydroxylase superfamily)
VFGGLLFYFTPVVLGAAAIEALVLARRRGDYDWRAYFSSLGNMAARRAIRYVAPVGVLGPAFAWTYQHRLYTVALDNWLAFVLLFVGQEFCYYWLHRGSHRIRWFWADHSVHHSPNQLNFAAAYRLGWMSSFAGLGVFYLPLVWLGFPPQAVLATLSINLLYQFWLHADWIPKLGWLEYVFNTPSHHRVHHAANLDYLDANYGGVLIVFDRLFGTLIVEREDLPCRYGLVKPLTAYNPLTIAFHEWLAIARDVARARSPREAACYLFGPPGWRPDGQGLTTADLRRMAAAPAE